MVFIPSCATDSDRADYLRAAERNLSTREEMVSKAEMQLAGWEKRLGEREARIAEREKHHLVAIEEREKPSEGEGGGGENSVQSVTAPKAVKGKGRKAKRQRGSFPAVKNSWQFWLDENRASVLAEVVKRGLPTTKVLEVAGEQWRAVEDRSRWESMMEEESERVRKLKESGGKSMPATRPSGRKRRCKPASSAAATIDSQLD